MDVSIFIASRLRFKGRMAMVCIAISFLVMIIAVSVSSGFRHAIRDGLAEVSGDIQITPVDMNYIGGTSPVARYPSWLDRVSAIDGVEDVSAAVYRAGIIKNGDNIHGVVFKGVEPSGSDSLETMTVKVPGRLADMLQLAPGDDMLAYFVGERVRARKFRVASVYDPMVDAEDKMVVYAPISDLQRLNGWTSGQVSALEVRLDDSCRNVHDMKRLSDIIGFTIYSASSEDDETVVAESAADRYPQLFDWLNLIDFNVLFILVLMTVVAGFNMISGLLIMLFENISTIGLLKALGMTDRSIAKIFLASSSVIVFKGMAAGNISALLFCLIQDRTRFLSLDPANYFVSFVPVHADIGLILLADLAAFCIIMLLLLVPSLFIARVDPAKSVSVR